MYALDPKTFSTRKPRGVCMTYELIDSGSQEKLERFGSKIVCRPSPNAIWEKSKEWEHDLHFLPKKREWDKSSDPWAIEFNSTKLILKQTAFGHIGCFPEHQFVLDFLKKSKPKKVLNLFAYTGFLSLALSKMNATVTHVDSSKKVIEWAKENAQLNNIENIRWILEDCTKFCKKQSNRNEKYDCIILDPPTFGRGAKNEVFKIEEDLMPLLHLLKELLSHNPTCFFLSCHSPNLNEQVLKNCMMQVGFENVEMGQMLLPNSNVPAGFFAGWRK